MNKIKTNWLRNIRWTRRRILGLVGAAAVVVAAVAAWNVWLSRTKIAFVNFQPIALQGFAQANDNSFVKLSDVSVKDIGRLSRYDIIFINGMGLNITAEQRAVIQKLANGGTPVYTTMATNPENNISNLTAEETALVQAYMMHGGRKNYRSLLSYLRRNIDGKIWFTGTPASPESKPSDYLYYPAGGEEREFLSVADYEKFMRKEGIYVKGGKNIIVTGQITDPSDLIKALAKTGRYNVYSIASMTHLLDYAAQIRPDAIINLAHGRLGDDMVAYLKRNNTLLFDPLTINGLKEDWESDPMGMLGGFMSQSVVMPEIDGAIRTSALFAQRKDKSGLLQPYAMPERLEEFVSTVDNYLSLRSKANADKRVAVVYFKGPGQSALVASGMEVIPSLYNFLKSMKAEGYNLSGLPATEAEFAEQIRRRGSLFNSFAAGDAERFMQTGSPQLVSAADYAQWTKAALAPAKAQEVDKAFGAFPGDHNLLKTADGQLAFPRLQYGNVVLLPQPMAGEGKDEFKIVHGTDQVPPHSYIAPYLWIQRGFKADALIHFGTHGSLEFTPKKQVALSSQDWPDRLVGTLPHFYLYTIDNVGEAMTAKRRSYAGIVSYLTPPFHESNLRGVYAQLEKKLREYQGEKADKKAVAAEIKSLSSALGLDKDLSLDASKPYSDDDISRIETYAEELSAEKVSGTPYILGVPYSEGDIRSSVFSMTVDPLAYCKYNIDRLLNRADPSAEKSKYKFADKYIAPAKALVSRLYGNDGAATDELICGAAGITKAQLDESREIMRRQNAPKGMLAMMMAAAKKEKKGGKPAMQMMQMHTDSMTVPEPKNNPIAKFMRRQMRKMLATKDPGKMLDVARKMGASPEALKKMEAAMKKKTGKGGGMSAMSMGSEPQHSRQQIELAQAIGQIETAITNVGRYRRALAESPQGEIKSLLGALGGGYTEPSPGGDPIANPNTLPTGRNLFAINAEETPSEDAWEKGVALAKNTIADYQKRHNGEFPRKVSYTLWSGEFIQTGGATIAQVLYMLGVEPVRDRYGRVNDLKLIPAKQLGRPRIDVVVQTSGQLRDLAASRLFLISRAVRMAAAADDGSQKNMVKEGVEESERYLIDKGVSPKAARELSEHRVFGGANGGYGSGIQGMVEAGNKWKDEKEIADTYMRNMGAYYGDQDGWQSYAEDAFAAALTRTDAVVQPRQNNSWGALSLDHVYEFMGGMNLAVRNVTGKDPDAYFSDYRNRNNYRVQDSKEAIAVEARSKLLNPSYVKEAMQGGSSSTDALAEMARNAYGWNVMKPKAVDKQLWDEMYNVYVADKYNLGVKEQMGKVNPAAMQELTATMMETARKGYWKATPQQLAGIAKLHTELVAEYGPSGSSFEGSNADLQGFIAKNSDAAGAKTYKQSMDNMAQTSADKDMKGMVMQKTTSAAGAAEAEGTGVNGGLIAVVVVLVVFVALLMAIRKKRKNQ